MFRELFLPEKIGNRYLFAKRVVGFDIGKTHVSATQLLFKGTTVTVEKSITIALENGTAGNYDERVVKALKTIKAELGPYDQVRTALASSVVVFKELKLPFLDHNKLRMVVDFEVEPLLPFALQDAVIDFITTKQHTETKSSEILVAAVQKQYVIQHLDLFAQAGIDVATVTVDFFDLYAVTQLIPGYAQMQAGLVLIDLGSYTTTIAYIFNGQLRLVRSLPKGTVALAKIMSQALHNEPAQALDQLRRFGADKDADALYVKAMQSAFAQFWQEILFTINSFAAQVDEQHINKVVLLGTGAQIKNIAQSATQALALPTELFAIKKILAIENPTIVAHNGLPQESLLSLCTALGAPIISLFNVRQKELRATNVDPLFVRQLIVALVLSLSLLVGVGIYTFVQLGRVSAAVNQAQAETVTLLKSTIKQLPDTSENIEEVIKQADTLVKKEEKLWFSFANPERTPFLAYLLELTNLVSKQELGFVIDKLVINDTTMVLTGHVKDDEALKAFEKALKQSKMLAHFEKQPLPEFTNMKIRLKG